MAVSWNRILVGLSLKRRVPCYPGVTVLQTSTCTTWLAGGIRGNLLCDVCRLLETIKNQFVAQSGMLLTKCGKTKMQWGEAGKCLHDGVFMSTGWRGKKDDSVCLWKGVASLKPLLVESPRASHPLFFRPHILYPIIQPKEFYRQW